MCLAFYSVSFLPSLKPGEIKDSQSRFTTQCLREMVRLGPKSCNVKPRPSEFLGALGKS